MVIPIRTARIIGLFIVLGAALILLHVFQQRRADTIIIFSPRRMLEGIWNGYKERYVDNQSGRTIDRSRNDVTTSEGQGYTMLRAVWIGDRQTFDRSWQWTRDNLLHHQDHLYAWLFGRRPDGSYGILTEQGGQNSASDADTDIATALLFAHARWGDDAYQQAAIATIQDIWNKEVVLIGGKPYLAADDVEQKATGPVTMNPSYLAPYAYRMFATVDPGHAWNQLASDSYDVLARGMTPLPGTMSVWLPPDWIAMDRKTGQITVPPNGELSTEFSFDALRVPWRIALDWEWNKSTEAYALLKQFGFLDMRWQHDQRLAAAYHRDGSVALDQESPAMYGGTLGYFIALAPDDARAVYREKLLPLYSADADGWRIPLGYYDDNWAWFGLALYNHALPNLLNG